mmetsp:Transcript_53770/g.60070  ORF Transcript_53770/g.60070 Transcript_53770/m.60070 type:complete len:228 (+) Transcript_53770:1247-1930(+)
MLHAASDTARVSKENILIDHGDVSDVATYCSKFTCLGIRKFLLFFLYCGNRLRFHDVITLDLVDIHILFISIIISYFVVFRIGIVRNDFTVVRCPIKGFNNFCTNCICWTIINNNFGLLLRWWFRPSHFNCMFLCPDYRANVFDENRDILVFIWIWIVVFSTVIRGRFFCIKIVSPIIKLTRQFPLIFSSLDCLHLRIVHTHDATSSTGFRVFFTEDLSGITPTTWK